MKPFSELNIPNGSVPGQKIDFVKEVYIPCLSNCHKHKRLTFSFNASVFIDLSEGIEKLIKNNGTIQLIIGQTISDDEYKSIEDGEQKRKENFENLCLKNLELFFSDENNTSHFKSKMGLLTNLIGAKKLEIKCAFKERQANNTQPLQHSKVAIFDGVNNEQIVWSSSANLTHTALYESLEDTPIYKSFRIESGYNDHGPGRIEFFDKMWNLKQFEGFTIDSVPSEFYRKWAEKFPHIPSIIIPDPPDGGTTKINDFNIPDYIDSHDPDWKHQGEAVKAWVDNDYHGILAMATGSGKTITAMIAAKKLHESMGAGPLLIVVSAPYNVLVSQWVDEIKEFGILALNVPALSSRNKLKEIKKQLLLLKHNKISVAVLVTSIDYLKNKQFQELLENHKDSKKLLIGDEVHNLAQEGFAEKPPLFFDYRLGLSATPESKFNQKRDAFLMDYFGDIVFRFKLKEAIGKCLVEYNYYLHKVFLREEEMDDWVGLTRQIEVITSYTDINDSKVTRLLQQRSKILSLAMNKIIVLKKALKDIKSDTISKTIMYFSEQDPEQMNQANELLDELDIKAHQITCDESPKERNKIIDNFKSDYYKVLTAKRILDEGVNIPAIEVAYIVSSNSQPRQWTQRRGRVLRKAENKTEANIHDFIVLPTNTAPRKYQKKLVEKELERVDAFASLAKNQYKEGGAALMIAKIYKEYLISN